MLHKVTSLTDMPSLEKKKSGKVASTFVLESSVPKLPLPDMAETLEQLQQSLRPLYCGSDRFYKDGTDAKQLDKFCQEISEFAESELAAKLQATLAEYDASSDCYLDNLHLDINNNSAREPEDDVLPRNPFLLLGDDIIPNVSQVDRSAVLVHAALRFVAALRQGVLPADLEGGTGQPRSMSPYLNLFGTTRCPVFAPGEVERFDLEKAFTDSDLESNSWSDSDEEEEGSVSSSGTSSGDGDTFTRHGITMARYADSRHILVISRGQYYTVDVLDTESNVLYNSSHLTTIFDHILLDSSSQDERMRAGTAVGSLTSHSFRNWKYSRKRLEKKFPSELRLIDSALFVLVLDHSCPGDGDGDGGCDGDECDRLQILGGGSEESGGMGKISRDFKRLFYGTSIIDDNGHQVGSCVSRWYDKLQLVVTQDSQASVIWDCFAGEGSTVLRFVSETYTESILRLAREVNQGDPKFSLWPSVSFSSVADSSHHKVALELDPRKVIHKIKWDFSDILNTHIHLSENKLADLISKYDMLRLSIPYGHRDAALWGVTPDSMVQVALQVSHYALYGRMAYSFEPVSMRRFKNSRSCFINVQDDAMLEFCQDFITGSLDDAGKLSSFLKICNHYSERVKVTKMGAGFEKHFNAMRYLFKFNEHYGVGLNAKDQALGEAIFESPLLAPFTAPELLAANCGNAATNTFAITPAQSSGFAVGYTIMDDHCDLTVTSQYRQGARLMFMLNWVLAELTRMRQTEVQGTINTKKGYKVSPLVDKLYEMDNALMHLKRTPGKSKVIKGYSFFDIQPHWGDSANASTSNSVNNSSVQLSSMASATKLNVVPTFTHSSAAPSVPTESEKQETGFQIKHLTDQEHTAKNNCSINEDDISTVTSAGHAISRRNNVIKSKFDIDFDRAGVGKKVTSVFN